MHTSHVVSYIPMIQVPKGDPTLFIGQEFLDALPVHQFQYTPKGWRERLVDINVSESGGVNAASVEEAEGGETPAATPAASAGEAKGKGDQEGDQEGDAAQEKSEKVPDFR